jgi:hypothetical protein
MSIYMGSNVAQCVSFCMAMAMMVLLNFQPMDVDTKENRLHQLLIRIYEGRGRVDVGKII